MLGAFVGAVLVWLHYLPHWGATQDPGLKLACFCTGPAIRDAKAAVDTQVLTGRLADVATITVNPGAEGASQKPRDFDIP